MPAIEVERKFNITAESKRAILALATEDNPPQTKCFRDEYFDEQLAICNKWLRKRNQTWELKVPLLPPGHHDQSNSHTTVYRELSGDSVWPALNLTSQPAAPSYAVLHTVRTAVSIDWLGFSVGIVLDECSARGGFSCHVGELEILVDCPDRVPEATLALQQLASHLSLASADEKDSKLVKYIKLFRPALYTSLCQNLQNRH